MRRAKDHVFPSWSAPVRPEIVSAHGIHFTDRDGQRCLGLASQFVFTNLSHRHPKVVAAVVEQAQRL